MNVYSHLLPALYFTLHLFQALGGYGDYEVFQNGPGRAFMTFSAIAFAFDMWSSVIFHLYNPMGQLEEETLLKYDLSGIVAVMLASFVGIAYPLFADYSWERSLIMGIITPTIITNFFVLFHPACRKDSMHCYKMVVIATTQVLLYATAIVGRLYLSTDYHVEVIYPRMFEAFAYVILGFFFYISRYPEKISFLKNYE